MIAFARLNASQSGAYTVLYLSVLHSGYSLFLHYTVSFHRAVPDPNWFRFPLLGLALVVVVLQWTAFTHGVRERRSRLSRSASSSCVRRPIAPASI